MISFGQYALQGAIVSKSEFISNEDKKPEDLKVMVNCALAEARHFSNLFKIKVNIQMQKVSLADKESLLWFFDMPEQISKSVKKQLFINIIVGDKIVGLSSSQFENQKFGEVRDFLTDTIATLKKIDDKEKIKNPCK